MRAIPVPFSGHPDGANSASGDQGRSRASEGSDSGSQERHPSCGGEAAKAKAATPAAAPGALTTDDQKIVYAVGLSMAQQLSQLGLSRAELEIVKRALTDSAAGKPAIELSTWGPKINTFAQARATSGGGGKS